MWDEFNNNNNKFIFSDKKVCIEQLTNAKKIRNFLNYHHIIVLINTNISLFLVLWELWLENFTRLFSVTFHILHKVAYFECLSISLSRNFVQSFDAITESEYRITRALSFFGIEKRKHSTKQKPTNHNTSSSKVSAVTANEKSSANKIALNILNTSSRILDSWKRT